MKPIAQDNPTISSSLLSYLFANRLHALESPEAADAPLARREVAAIVVSFTLWQLSRQGLISLVLEEEEVRAFWRSGDDSPGFDGVLLRRARRPPDGSPAVLRQLRSLYGGDGRTIDEVILQTVSREGQERGYLTESGDRAKGSDDILARLAPHFDHLAEEWQIFRKRERQLHDELLRTCRLGLAPGNIATWSLRRPILGVGAFALLLVALLIVPVQSIADGRQPALIAVATSGVDLTLTPQPQILLILLSCLPILCISLALSGIVFVVIMLRQLEQELRARAMLAGSVVLVAIALVIGQPGVPMIAGGDFLVRILMSCALACAAVAIATRQARAVIETAEARGYLVEPMPAGEMRRVVAAGVALASFAAFMAMNLD